MQQLLRDDIVDIAFHLPRVTPDWIARQSVYAIRFAIIASSGDAALAASSRGIWKILEQA